MKNFFRKIVEALSGSSDESTPRKLERESTPLSNRAARRADAKRCKVSPYRGESKPAKNTRRHLERAFFRTLRRDRVRVRRPADLRPHFAALGRSMTAFNRALSKPVVVEHEGTVQS